METARNHYHYGLIHHPIFEAIAGRFQDTKSKFTKKKYHIQGQIAQKEVRAHEFADSSHHWQALLGYKIQGHCYGVERLRSEQIGRAFQVSQM